MWGVRGFVRQSIVRETREKLTMGIASVALAQGGNGTVLPGEEADAAVFEGRSAAEQVIVRLAPSLVAEPIAAVILLYGASPAGVPILAGAVTVTIATIIVALLRKATILRQRGAWRKYMEVARDTLTGVRAAPELLASGYEEAYLDRLRSTVYEWTETAARAERSAALFQRIPFAATVAVAVVLIVDTPSLESGQLIRLGVFFPPLAGMMRTVYEFVRTSPRLQSLAAVLDADDKDHRLKLSAPVRQPPELPCEIRFEGVSFNYGDLPVLTNISFVWKPGEVLGIKGPNGSGKSTLLKLMLGLLQPSTGRILVGGIDLREIDLPTWRRAIAYLPQRPYVAEKATVIEAMRLTAPGLAEKEARKALEELGVWERLEADEHNGKVDPLHTPIMTLSVGVRQRTLLARVLARLRPFTFLDEPTETIDKESHYMLLQLFKKRAAQGAIAVASHDVALLANTNILDLGDPENRGPLLNVDPS
jgi:ATP-binding cassette subfamily C protein CydCD